MRARSVSPHYVEASVWHERSLLFLLLIFLPPIYSFCLGRSRDPDSRFVSNVGKGCLLRSPHNFKPGAAGIKSSSEFFLSVDTSLCDVR